MRYKAVANNPNGIWYVYDEKRGCKILSSVSVNANYNQEVAEEVAAILNAATNDRTAIYKEVVSEIADNIACKYIPGMSKKSRSALIKYLEELLNRTVDADVKRFSDEEISSLASDCFLFSLWITEENPSKKLIKNTAKRIIKNWHDFAKSV